MEQPNKEGLSLPKLGDQAPHHYSNSRASTVPKKEPLNLHSPTSSPREPKKAAVFDRLSMPSLTMQRAMAHKAADGSAPTSSEFIAFTSNALGSPQPPQGGRPTMASTKRWGHSPYAPPANVPNKDLLFSNNVPPITIVVPTNVTDVFSVESPVPAPPRNVSTAPLKGDGRRARQPADLLTPTRPLARIPAAGPKAVGPISTATAPPAPFATPLSTAQIEGGASTSRHTDTSPHGPDPLIASGRRRQSSRSASGSNGPLVGMRIPQNKFFQNYHVMLLATKAENEAARFEAKGLAKMGTLEGALSQEKALWIRSNYAVLNKGALPIQNSLPTATISPALLTAAGGASNGPRQRLSISEPPPLASASDAGTAQWERSEVLVVVCNQMLVRHLQSLSDDHITLSNELVGLCERLLWTPHQLWLTKGPSAEKDTIAPQLLALGPLAGSDPFVSFGPLKSYLLGCTLTNYASVQRLSGEPSEAIVATLERGFQLQELQFSCQTIFNLSAALVEAHRFAESLDAALLCVDLANHYLSLPFLESEKSSPAYEAYINETATIAVLAHHLIVTVATWSGSPEVSAYHAQLALGCSTTFLGHAHALTTRSAQRLEAVAWESGAGSNTGADESTPPLVPLQMAVFGSNVRPSAILSYALCYPLSSPLQRRLQELRGGEMKPVSPRGRRAKSLRLSAQAIFSKHYTNVLQERKTGLPAISIASVAGPATKALSLRNRQSDEPSSASKSATGLVFARPPPPGTRLMPPLTPKYRSFSNLEKPVIRHLVAQVDGRQERSSSAMRSLTPNNSPLQLAIEAQKRSSTSPQRHPSTMLTADTSAFLGGSPAPRFQSLRTRSVMSDATAADDGSLMPGFTLEKPRGSILLPDRHVLVPQPPAQVTAKALSIIPLRDYELYNSLQQGVDEYLRPPASPFGSLSVSGSKRAAWQRASIVGTTAPRSHSHAILKNSDADLRELSEVIPDHTIADEHRWHAAARVLQHFWLIICAKNERNNRAEMAGLMREYGIYGERISNAHREYKERKPAVAERRARARQAAMISSAAIVQAHLRGLLSAEVAAGKMLISLQVEREQAQELRIQRLAAVLIQSLFRGYLSRKRLNHTVAAARTIQRTYRLFAAYQHVRLLVFKKRQRVRAIKEIHNKFAARLQRWWRHLLQAIYASRELQARKERMRLFMEDYAEKDKQYWDLFRNVNEEECMDTIGRVGRAYIARRKFGIWGARFIKETKAARIIQRFVRCGIATTIKNGRLADKLEQRRLKRADEERQVAATDMQSICRMFLAKRRCQHIRDRNAAVLRSAIIIQNLFRRAIRRKVIHQLLSADRWDKTLYVRAEARRYAATKVQSVWRMHRARQFVAQYRHYKLVIEPHCANILQRAVRCFLSRCRYRSRAIEVASMTRVAQAIEIKPFAAAKIQSTWRMFKVSSDPKYGRRVHPTFVASKAASKIQKMWRMVAAKGLVRQLLLARMHRDHAYVNRENLDMYATKIQSVVRMAVLNKKFVRQAYLSKQELSLVRIQRAGRRYLRLAQQHQEALAEADAAWHAPQEGSSPREGPALRNKKAQAAYHAKVVAGHSLVRWAKGCLARRQLAAAKAARQQQLDAAIQSERANAATSIQRWSRGLSEK